MKLGFVNWLKELSHLEDFLPGVGRQDSPVALVGMLAEASQIQVKGGMVLNELEGRTNNGTGWA